MDQNEKAALNAFGSLILMMAVKWTIIISINKKAKKFRENSKIRRTYY